ncbi:MAG: DNA polymerase Y family protein [Burkholderiaceae bacterium]|nr:DNA polymerase Y family protein [Burkholderiaceae bacterium]
MALWLALALPALPLQLATRALDAATAASLPLVITDGPAQRPQVAFCNDSARGAGIAPGLKLAAAQALAPRLVARARQPEHEASALHELACWGYQFSAAVVLRDDDRAHGLLLEIGGSLRLFGGRTLLLRRLRRELDDLGYRAQAGLAPTPLAAWWIALARAGGRETRDALGAADLSAVLDPLPLALTGWDQTTQGTLHTLGLRTLGDLQRLPRAAVRKRFAATLLADLDHAYGRVPDPQPPFEPPARFEAAIELPADVADCAQLMFPAQRLLRSLEGFLRGRAAGTTELVFETRHSPRRTQPVVPTTITLALAAPERDAQRLGKLLAERLTRVQLPEPAIALALTVTRLQRFAALNASLLPPSPTDGVSDLDWLKLAETLHARLGSARVFQLQPVDDHRPEHAQRAVPLSPEPIAAQPTDSSVEPPPRPLLLLPAPQPLAAADASHAGDPPPAYGGPLMLIAGPERIEAGWWDLGSPAHGQKSRAVHRDYFVARNPRGQVLWIYRDLAAPRGWFLHGFFA